VKRRAVDGASAVGLRPGAWYDAMYVAFGLIGTGVEKFTCCQPDADSPENVAWASSCPLAVHRLPMCVPVLAATL
jgi:hypothetical protein